MKTIFYLKTFLILLISIQSFSQNVGIGTNSPEYILDVNGRMRIRSGGSNSTSAGIYLNDNSQNVRAFIGMEDNNFVGLFGSNGATGKFSVNVTNGAIKVNGSVGSAGQVIHSNGPGAAPSWQSSTNVLYNNTNVVVSSSSTLLDENNPEINIPGLNYTFTLSGPAKAIVMLTVDAISSICALCAGSQTEISLFLNNSYLTSFHRLVINDGTIETISGTKFLTLGTGTHTLQVKASVTGPDVTIGQMDTPSMIVQVIPQ